MPRLRRRRLAGLVAVAATALVVGTLGAAASPASAAPEDLPATAEDTSTTFGATEDTQINSSAPNAKYGAAPTMATCGSGPATCAADGGQEKRALVKFSVGGLTGTVVGATLRLYATTTPVPALTVQPVDPASWSESSATWANSNALPAGPGTFTSPAGTAQGYYEVDVTAAVTGDGAYGFSIANPDPTTLRLATSESTAPVAAPELVVTTDAVSLADPVVVAAGDISTRTKVGGNKLTSDLILQINPTYVLALGDDQYPAGALVDYQTFFGATWGRFKAKIKPAPGNHEYYTDTSAAGYYSYFGSAASPSEPGCAANCKGYYSYDVGNWHVVALNTNQNNCQYVGCQAGSPQLDWLETDLAANTKPCIAAYWHHPRWSSGTHHGSDPKMDPIWTTLYAHGVDIALNGHEHNYERFRKQNTSGVADDAGGIREFIVGTGGTGLYGFGPPKINSQVRSNQAKGVLKLTLHPGSYNWQFQPAAGYTFTDSGSDTCNS